MHTSPCSTNPWIMDRSIQQEEIDRVNRRVAGVVGHNGERAGTRNSARPLTTVYDKFNYVATLFIRHNLHLPRARPNSDSLNMTRSQYFFPVFYAGYVDGRDNHDGRDNRDDVLTLVNAYLPFFKHVLVTVPDKNECFLDIMIVLNRFLECEYLASFIQNRSEPYVALINRAGQLLFTEFASNPELDIRTVDWAQLVQYFTSTLFKATTNEDVIEFQYVR